MLGIAMEILPQIAAQPTRHSWMKPILEASKGWTELQEDHVEFLLNYWIVNKVKELYPEIEDTYNIARIARSAMLLVLEREAITMFLEKNNQWADCLFEAESAEEAAMVAAMDAMASREEQDEATKVLEMIESGEL
ncbi:hypothetical protein EVA_20030, partial [gut metagenome]